MTLFFEPEKYCNTVWSPGCSRQYLWPRNKEHRGGGKETLWRSFCDSWSWISGNLPKGLNFSASPLSGSGSGNNQKRSLKTIIMENVVNLKYLIRIYFLEKHELGGVCEACWEGMTPVFLWVWLFLTNALVIGSRDGWFAGERRCGIGKGSISEGGQSEFSVGLSQTKGHPSGSLASRHSIHGEVSGRVHSWENC